MAKRKKAKHGEEEAGEAWLLPYSDLMTLLLAVFIVLFAVSKIDQAKAESIAQAFTENMMAGGSGAGEGSGAGDGAGALDVELPEEDAAQEEPSAQPSDGTFSGNDLEVYLGQHEYANLANLKTELDVMLENKDMAYIVTSIDKRGLVISLNNAILFESGRADVIAGQEDTLIKIAETVNKLENYIRIEGHTDNVPISTAAYPSNWELSTARATSVVRLFIDKCNMSPEKVVAVGYGEHKPVADNATAEGRAKNRRIDIIVLSEKYNNLEQQIAP
jgi:chemotaxis protein MotB